MALSNNPIEWWNETLLDWKADQEHANSVVQWIDAICVQLSEALNIAQNPSIEQLKHILENCWWWFEKWKYDQLPAVKSEYLERSWIDIARLIDQVLHTWIIRDIFDSDHNARRNFYQQNEFWKKLSPFKRQYSKLSGNNLLICIYSIDDLLRYIKRKFSEKYKECLELQEKFAQLWAELWTYNWMTFEEKSIFAKKIDDAIFNFFEILST